MKNCLNMLLLALTLESCNSGNTKDTYPEIVLKHNIKNVYDVARYEMYKLSSNSNCSCIAYSFRNKSKNDTFNILFANLNLDTIYFRMDTVTLYFSFVDNTMNRVYYINDLHKDCFQCIGIEFVNGSLYKAYFAEEGYFFYKNNKSIIPDSIFIKNVEKINPLLVRRFHNYMKINL